MNRSEIVDQVIELLRQRGSRGSIHEDPYKHDFFRLFAAAYNAGFTRGVDAVRYADALGLTIAARAPELTESYVWRELYKFWLEWTYAWDHAGELKR